LSTERTLQEQSPVAKASKLDRLLTVSAFESEEDSFETPAGRGDVDRPYKWLGPAKAGHYV